jgi:pSer/pThr/pTyr-binding forkhead associated (FHA) protein
MSDKNLSKQKKTYSADWFVQGVLSRIGDIFDKLTGRGWQGTSSLATSELSEKLKLILDSEMKDLGVKGRFVPHNIKLKMQWNKFATDSDDVTQKLENELTIAAIDHINDNLYHTYQPLKIEVRPDYFIEGVKFFASFGEFDKEEGEIEVNVTVPQMNVQDLIPPLVEAAEPEGEVVVADFTVGEKRKAVELRFVSGKRLGVGRTKENDLCIEDGSISKIHAALVLNSEDQLMVADTGSTNGTFINDNRIAYGRAFVIGEGDKVKFGTVEVFLRRTPKPVDFATKQEYEVEMPKTEAFQLEPTIAAQLPTEAFQTANQPAETIASPIVQPTIPQISENNLAVEPKPIPTTQTENIPKEIPPHQNQNAPIETQPVPKEIPVAQPTMGADDLVPEGLAGKTNYEVNPTEPRVKLNFEDEEKK